MQISIVPCSCPALACCPAISEKWQTSLFCHKTLSPLDAAVGEQLLADETPIFEVTGHIWLPVSFGSSDHVAFFPVLKSLREIKANEGQMCLERVKNGFSLAALTLSDKGSSLAREDRSGPAIIRMVTEALPICFHRNFILPDDSGLLRALLAKTALEDKYDIVITTGGTGLGERDITPQATRSLLDLPLPGFVAAMLQESLKHTPHAMISRAAAGLLGKCLVINLPGSLRGATENLAAVLPAMRHALDKAHGDAADCGG